MRKGSVMKILLITLIAILALAEPYLAPDGQYYSGQPTLAPNGQYIDAPSGEIELAPDGTYIPVTPNDSSYEYEYSTYPDED